MTKLVLSVLVVIGVAACDWLQPPKREVHEYVYEEAGFAVSFPREPIEVHTNPPLVTLMSVFPNMSYRADYSPKDFKGTPESLAALRKQYAGAHDVTVAGADVAFEADEMIGGHRYRLRAILAHGHLYQLVTGGSELDDGDAAAFFATFRLLPTK